MDKIKNYYFRQANKQLTIGFLITILSGVIIYKMIQFSTESNYLIGMGLSFAILIITGVYFVTSGINLKRKLFEELKSLLKNNSNNLQCVEAKYIGVKSIKFINKYINSEKVSLHLITEAGKTFYMLINPQDIYGILRYLKETIPFAKFKINTHSINEGFESYQQDNFQTLLDLV
jgi:hypothetical protein